MKQQKRFSTQEHVKIVFEIFKLVPYLHKITAQEIHQQLTEQDIYRDIRTIQRNLALLVSMGFIEQDSRSKPYGYQKMSHQLSPLNTQETLVLQLAMNHLQGLLPNSAIAVIKARLGQASQTDNVKVQQWLKKVSCECSFNELPIQTLTLIEKLTTALYHNHWIRLIASNQNKSPLYCMPIGLIRKASGIELITATEIEEPFTTHTFRLSDIQEVKLSTFTFEYPTHFDLEWHHKQQRNIQRIAPSIKGNQAH